MGSKKDGMKETASMAQNIIARALQGSVFILSPYTHTSHLSYGRLLSFSLK